MVNGPNWSTIGRSHLGWKFWTWPIWMVKLDERYMHWSNYMGYLLRLGLIPRCSDMNDRSMHKWICLAMWRFSGFFRMVVARMAPYFSGEVHQFLSRRLSSNRMGSFLGKTAFGFMENCNGSCWRKGIHIKEMMCSLNRKLKHGKSKYLLMRSKLIERSIARRKWSINLVIRDVVEISYSCWLV